jgi:hypothetical protein
VFFLAVTFLPEVKMLKRQEFIQIDSLFELEDNNWSSFLANPGSIKIP